MNTGKTLFAQMTDFPPWSTLARIVARYGGDGRVRTLYCTEQCRAMAFAQLTYRESLREIEACLSAASKLYHMGFREPVRRLTLADANETREWRIDAEFARRLIVQARKLYADESLDLELTNTVYVLDSLTIDLCLSLFPWAHFRTTKAAVKIAYAGRADEIGDGRIGLAHFGERLVGRNAPIHDPDALCLAVLGLDLTQGVAQRREVGRVSPAALRSERKATGVTTSAITTWV